MTATVLLLAFGVAGGALLAGLAIGAALAGLAWASRRAGATDEEDDADILTVDDYAWLRSQDIATN